MKSVKWTQKEIFACKRMAKKAWLRRKTKKQWNQDFSDIKKSIRNCEEVIPDLTTMERKDIKEYWSRYRIDFPFEWHRFFYAITGVKDVRYVPEPVFHQIIKPCFNNIKYASIWGDKSYTDLFIRGTKTARSVVRNIHGRFVDEQFQIINMQRASEIINSYEKLVIKPSAHTHTGQGVELLESPYDLYLLHDKYRENYVFQIPLKQTELLSKLNPSSINTIRVNSVLLGTEAYVMSAFVKVGQAGEFADNHGKDRFFIGIDRNGAFCNYAINHDLKKFNTIPSGFEFAGVQLPFFPEVCSAIKNAHKCIPHFGFAFWDVCVNEENEPVIVEVNLRYPDTVIPQTCGIGGFLGDYTDEILRQCATIRARQGSTNE